MRATSHQVGRTRSVLCAFQRTVKFRTNPVAHVQTTHSSMITAVVRGENGDPTLRIIKETPSSMAETPKIVDSQASTPKGRR
jgi:hypothetical protein